jgi:hypothetical protein
MSCPSKHRFSGHAISRWAERFPELIKSWDADAVSSLAKEFYKSEPYRAILNNTSFMANVYEKYGSDRGEFQFYTTDEVVFICRDKTMITLYERDSRFPKLRTHNYKSKMTA